MQELACIIGSGSSGICHVRAAQRFDRFHLRSHAPPYVEAHIIEPRRVHVEKMGACRGLGFVMLLAFRSMSVGSTVHRRPAEKRCGEHGVAR